VRHASKVDPVMLGSRAACLHAPRSDGLGQYSHHQAGPGLNVCMLLARMDLASKAIISFGSLLYACVLCCGACIIVECPGMRGVIVRTAKAASSSALVGPGFFVVPEDCVAGAVVLFAGGTAARPPSISPHLVHLENL